MTTEPRFSLIVKNKLAATEGRERGWVAGENSSLEVVDTPPREQRTAIEREREREREREVGTG